MVYSDGNGGYTQAELERRLKRMETYTEERYKECANTFAGITDRLARGAESFSLLEMKIKGQGETFHQLNEFQNREIARIETMQKIDREEHSKQWREIKTVAYALFLALAGNFLVLIMK